MKMRSLVAAGLGLAACMCFAIAGSQAYEVKRVGGVIDSTHEISDPASSETTDGSMAVAVQPTLTADFDQVGSIYEDGARGVPASCGTTGMTQNLNTTRVDLFPSMVRCAGAGVSTKNSWARCYKLCDDGFGNAADCFPGDPGDPSDNFVLQCIKFGVQDNQSPAGLDWDIDVRLVALSGNLNPGGPACSGSIQPPTVLAFNDWFVPPSVWKVIHFQKVRIPNNFQGLIRMEMTRLISIPAGTELLIEIHSESRQAVDGGDNGSFIAGGNDGDGEIISGSNGTSIWSTDCGIPFYFEFLGINPGFTATLVLVLEGTFDGGSIVGACCNNTTGDCATGIAFSDCLGENDRFLAAGACDDFDPPCGTVTVNDECLGAIDISGSVCVPFDTRVAFDAPGGFIEASNCPLPIFKDVWYRYEVQGTTPSSISGTLVISTLGTLGFDSIVSVYQANNPTDPIGPICASIGLDDGVSAFSTTNGCVNDIPNRPPSSVDRSVYMFLPNASLETVVPGDVFFIRVGSPLVGVGGQGLLNVDFLPFAPAPPWGTGIVGSCCIPDGLGGVDCRIMATTFAPDCAALGGFMTLTTNFYEGRNLSDLTPDPNAFPVEFPLVEFSTVGCKTFPCAGPGESCWNALDLKAILQAKNGTDFGTFTRKTRKKLYFKYQLSASQSLVIDSCDSVDFDTFLEIFPETCIDPTGNTSGKASTDQIIVDAAGILLRNNDCVYDNEPENLSARGAGDPVQGAQCFGDLNGGTTHSCMCVTADSGPPGLDSGNFIIISLGALNPDLDESVPQINSIDPVPNIFDDDVTAVITVGEATECFSCTLDLTPPILVDAEEVFPILEGEPDCADGGATLANRTNEGCSNIVAGDPGASTPVTTPIALAGGNETIYIQGTGGVFDPQDPNLPTQVEDQDWYSIVLTERKRITWRLVAAEFTAQIQILRAGNPAEPCFVDGFVLNTNSPCDADTLDDLSIVACPGTYYLTIRQRPPNKPAFCPVDYLLCLDISNASPVGCCKGDMDNNNVVNGLDIQRYLDTRLHEPTAGNAGAAAELGGCSDSQFCRCDMNDDGLLNDTDDGLFALKLLDTDAPDCSSGDPLIDGDESRGQLPMLTTGALQSDLNPQHTPEDVDLALTHRSADSFSPNEDGDITDLVWWGVYRDTDAVFAQIENRDCLAPDNFTITYYESQTCPNTGDIAPRGGTACDESPNCSIPPLAVFSVGAAVNRVDTGLMVSGIQDGVDFFNSGNPAGGAIGESKLYRYSISHAAVPVTVVDVDDERKCYWVEIVNDTAPGRCMWRWVFSADGDGKCYRQRKQNQEQTLGEYDCQRQRYPRTAGNITANIPPKKDLAFQVNLLLNDGGCGQLIIPTGRCCFGSAGNEDCVETVQQDCEANFNGIFAQGIDCSVACSSGRCRVTCEDGDLREAEGCGFDKNGGCDFDEEHPRDFMINLGFLTCDVFDFQTEETIVDNSIDVCGDVRRRQLGGTFSGPNADPDRDWYLFDTTGNGPVSDPSTEILLTIEAGFNVTVQLRELDREAFDGDGCSTLVASASVFVDANGVSNCQPLTINAGCILDGEYAIRVIGHLFGLVSPITIDCPEAGYRLNIRCRQCCFFADANGDPSQVCEVFDIGGNPFPGQPESEQCDQESNNGCDQDFADSSNAFEPLVEDPCNPTSEPFPGFGILICGKSWADEGTQDEDWWGPIVVNQSTEITIEVRAELQIGVQLREVGLAEQGNEGDCLLQDQDVSTFFAQSTSCKFDSFTECIEPGNWAIVVIPRSANFNRAEAGTAPCDFRSNYQIRVACGSDDGSCTPACPGGDGGQAPELQGLIDFARVGLVINNRPSDLNPQQNTRAADNFLTLSGGNLTRVTWWGFYQNVNGESCNDGTKDCLTGLGQIAGDTPDDFAIALFNDDNGDLVSPVDPLVLDLRMPGSLFAGLLEQDVDFTVNKFATGRRDLINLVPKDCRNEYQYEATLNVPIVLAAETCYWLQIVNRSTGACIFRWELSDDAELASALQFPDPANPLAPLDPIAAYEAKDEPDTPHDFAFCLDVEIGPTGCFDFTPEPNNDCAGALEITCLQGETKLITFDLVDYNTPQDKDGPNPCIPQSSCDPISRCDRDLVQNRDPSLVPRRESSAWFLFKPQENLFATITKVGGGAGVLATMTVFDAGITCNDLFDMNGDADETVQFLCDANGAPPSVSATFTAGQEYLILVSYQESTQRTITQSVPQTLSIECTP